MANPNPNESTRWKPGVSGNPGGMSKEVRDKIRINAEKAVYAQGLFLDGILSKLEGATPEERDALLRSDVNKIMSDVIDRAMGRASQHVDQTSSDGSASLPTRIVLVAPDEE